MNNDNKRQIRILDWISLSILLFLLIGGAIFMYINFTDNYPNGYKLKSEIEYGKNEKNINNTISEITPKFYLTTTPTPTIDPQIKIRDQKIQIVNKDLDEFKSAFEGYFNTGPNHDTHKFTDFIGYKNIISDAKSSLKKATCPNGIKGENLENQVNFYSIDNTNGKIKANTVDLSPLIKSYYLSEIKKDPNGDYYIACIDAQNSNLLIFTSKILNSNGTPIYKVIDGVWMSKL